MEIKKFKIDNGDDINVIIGQSHFIKTVDDISEIIATTVPGAKFAIAFNEASGLALIRGEGNDEELKKEAVDIISNIKAGHSFIILLKECYPINILSKLKMCDEVTGIYCASANPLTILTIEDDDGAAIIGIIDGVSPKSVETDSDKTIRRNFLKNIGYKY